MKAVRATDGGVRVVDVDVDEPPGAGEVVQVKSASHPFMDALVKQTPPCAGRPPGSSGQRGDGRWRWKVWKAWKGWKPRSVTPAGSVSEGASLRMVGENVFGVAQDGGVDHPALEGEHTGRLPGRLEYPSGPVDLLR